MVSSLDIKRLAASVGFDLCGITPARAIPEAERQYRSWLEHGYHGAMDWMTKYVDRRADASRLSAGLNSVIMVGLNYYQPNSQSIPLGMGRVSRYARGRDYHRVVDKMLRQLIARIHNSLDREVVHPARPKFKHWVDYGPMLERAYAQAAGMGFVGKNATLINRQFGSWIFLGEIVTSISLEPDNRGAIEHGSCGSCRQCIEACPTGAIVGDGMVDSRRCLSYLSVESRGEIPREFHRALDSSLFGCDICQEVCPLNQRRQQPTSHTDLKSEAGVGEFLDCRRLVELDEDGYLALAGGTSLMRAKSTGLQRNARVVLANQSS